MDKKTLENEIHKKLMEHTKEIVYRVWFSDAEVDVSDVGNRVTIIASSEFKAMTIESALYQTVEKAVNEAIGFETEIDYAFKDPVTEKTLSVLDNKAPQKRLDEMKALLNSIVTFVINNTDDITKKYIANEMRSGCVLSTENSVAYLSFDNPDLLKVVKKELSKNITDALKEVLNTDNTEAHFMYCGIEYEDCK